MLFMVLGVIIGIARGMHVRSSNMSPDAKEVLKNLKEDTRAEKRRQ